MRIPKDIKAHIRMAARHYKVAVESDDVIRSWLLENSLNNDSVLDQLIDMVEMGLGDAKGFIDFLESADPKEGNNEDYE